MNNENEFKIAYFSHDISSRCDLEILKLLSLYGAEGYGIFWILIEILHQNNNQIFSDDIQTIIQAFNLDEKKTYEVLTKFKLFKHEPDGGFYYSERVKRNIELQQIKRVQKQKAVRARWNADKEKAELQEFYKNEYKKVFNETPTMTPEEINNLYEISKANEDFKEKLPKTLKRLSKIKFDSNYKHTPLSSWLLKDNHYSSVANGEFSKKEEAIKEAIKEQTIYRPPKLTQEEETQVQEQYEEAKKKAEKIFKKIGKPI